MPTQPPHHTLAQGTPAAQDDAPTWRVIAARIGPDAAGRFERVGDGLRLHFDDGSVLTIRHIFPMDAALPSDPAPPPDRPVRPDAARRSTGDAGPAPSHAQPGSHTSSAAGCNTGTWRLDGHGWQLVSPSGRSVDLTLAERRFLACLAECAGQPVARALLIHCLVDDADTFDSHRLDVLVYRLRRKCSRDAGAELPLRTVRGLGYMLSW
ncbi:helix-turn-helix domain-containing protein [Luteimonas sp. RC10]|uniref:helix-turn-helix domain-containing protein n=1 Tax=Luteimonas sp. RC10 TaxID=2587035 RepID=UPI001618879B|nr:helix-turn-helix domain-containing protein [Luteimonas sp. RC10]MBB3342818.1 hypothetical protein [Luteimonas sp. RC10]